MSPSSWDASLFWWIGVKNHYCIRQRQSQWASVVQALQSRRNPPPIWAPPVDVIWTWSGADVDQKFVVKVIWNLLSERLLRVDMASTQWGYGNIGSFGGAHELFEYFTDTHVLEVAATRGALTWEAQGTRGGGGGGLKQNQERRPALTMKATFHNHHSFLVSMSVAQAPIFF